jgi:hypothetical protein
MISATNRSYTGDGIEAKRDGLIDCTGERSDGRGIITYCVRDELMLVYHDRESKEG